ncbi:hypothetical protein E2C01_095959 [Portunus trituberculatus]|uniref:Uncharacterized protein n=1 Tax=Portunus trituberculatus TaxID=210409 RepID=A0A5B7K0R2_PORTR|nr:hypothetical protein [Portunus trituberculatus]
MGVYVAHPPHPRARSDPPSRNSAGTGVLQCFLSESSQLCVKASHGVLQIKTSLGNCTRNVRQEARQLQLRRLNFALKCVSLGKHVIYVFP